MRNQRIIRNYVLFFLAGVFLKVNPYWAVTVALPVLILLSWKIDEARIERLKRKKLC